MFFIFVLMDYLIDYEYGALKDKRMRVKNCVNEFEAKGKLHNYLVDKHGEGELVITQCYCEDDVFGMFGDLFKG